jgi:hypothetical protein
VDGICFLKVRFHSYKFVPGTCAHSVPGTNLRICRNGNSLVQVAAQVPVRLLCPPTARQNMCRELPAHVPGWNGNGRAHVPATRACAGPPKYRMFIDDR